MISSGFPCVLFGWISGRLNVTKTQTLRSQLAFLSLQLLRRLDLRCPPKVLLSNLARWRRRSWLHRDFIPTWDTCCSSFDVQVPLSQEASRCAFPAPSRLGFINYILYYYYYYYFFGKHLFFLSCDESDSNFRGHLSGGSLQSRMDCTGFSRTSHAEVSQDFGEGKYSKLTLNSFPSPSIVLVHTPFDSWHCVC